MTRHHARTIATAASVSTVSVTPAFLFAVTSVQIAREFGLGVDEIGIATAGFFATGAVSSSTVGRLAERVGAENAMRGAALVALVSIALVTTWASDLATLVVSLAIGGVANATAQPSTSLFLSRRLPATMMGVGLGWKQSAVPLAVLMGGAAIPAVVVHGWRWAFLGGGVGCVLAAIAVPRGRATLRTGTSVTRPRPDMEVPTLRLLALGLAMASAAGSSLGTFLVATSVDAGYAESSAGLLAAAASLTGICGRLGVGIWADRARRANLVAASRLLLVGSCAYLLIGSLVPAAVAVGAGVGYAFGWAWPPLTNLALLRNNPTAPAAATGIVQTGVYAGAVVGPVLFGVVAAGTSFHLAWSVSAVLGLAASAVVAAARARLIAERELVPDEMAWSS